MPTGYDQLAINAVADALADAAAVHRSSASVADDSGLAMRLLERAEKLAQLHAEISSSNDDSHGSLMGILDRLRLMVDRIFGDDDDAALDASMDAKINVLTEIDSHLPSTELSPETRALLKSARNRISSGGAIVSDDDGLTTLPS
jgi:hypothetical protein